MELQNDHNQSDKVASKEESKKLISVSSSFSMVPQNLGELMTFARMLAESDLVPKDYRGKPGNIMVAMQMGSEIGIMPMQAVQNIAVINGKPSVYGDLGKALLRSRGCDIKESETEENRKTGVAWCVITRPGQDPVRRTFSIDDAKTAKLWGKDGPWSTYPFRQMGWRAFWFAARDAAPDILKGVAGREEVEDYDNFQEVKEIKKQDFEDIMPKRISESLPVSEDLKQEPKKEASIPQKEDAPISPEEAKEIKVMTQICQIEPDYFDSMLSGLGCKNGVILKSQFPEVMKWLKAMQPAS